MIELVPELPDFLAVIHAYMEAILEHTERLEDAPDHTGVRSIYPVENTKQIVTPEK